jgi:DNA primase
VVLKKAGTTFKGLCPFHGEKSPSFVVTPARETWHCFGCGLGGDIFSFVMQRDSVDFPTALRSLAGRAGVEISERTSREDAQRKRLREALDAAISFYHSVLTTHPQGQPALDYLRGRGFTDATISTFQLGWAPDSFSALTHALMAKRQMSEADLEGAGLVSRSQRGRGVYDRFRARVMFPIRDHNGGATGFTGRVLGTLQDAAGRDQGPKYLNTPATALFDKSRTLYLIDHAKTAIKKQQRVVLVEGNTDALMAHQQGFGNVVCSMGTALTAGQVELLTRYAPRIALAYDVDAAGQGAATFGATELTALVGEIERSEHKGRLTDVDVVRLPEGKDPDEVIRDDPDTWRDRTEHPQPIMEFLIDQAAERTDIRSVPGRQRMVDSVLPTLRIITDPVRRDGYLQLLSRRSGVDERVLLEALRKPETTSGRLNGAHAGAKISLEAVMASPGALDPKAVERALEPVESSLLRLLLTHPGLIAGVTGRLTPEMLSTTPARELLRALLGADAPFDRAAFLAGLEPTTETVARTLYSLTDPLPSSEEALRQSLDQGLLTLERARLHEMLAFKQAELSEAEAAGDTVVRDRLRQDVLALQRQRLTLDRQSRDTSLLSQRRHIPPTPTPTATGGHP